MATAVHAVVVCVIPEYHQIALEDAKGWRYAAVMGFIPGLRLEDYSKGQKVKLMVEQIGKALTKVIAIEPLSQDSMVTYAVGPLSPARERTKQLLIRLGVHKAEAAELYVRVLSSAACARLYKRLSKPVS
jgi:hypothetical protein